MHWFWSNKSRTGLQWGKKKFAAFFTEGIATKGTVQRKGCNSDSWLCSIFCTKLMLANEYKQRLQIPFPLNTIAQIIKNEICAYSHSWPWSTQSFKAPGKDHIHDHMEHIHTPEGKWSGGWEGRRCQSVTDQITVLSTVSYRTGFNRAVMLF